MTTKSLRVNIEEDLHRKARYKALALDTTLAAVVREQLRKWVEEEKPIVLPPETQPTSKITNK